MITTVKCSNPDCKKYNMTWRVPMDQGPLKSMYCDNCLIGKLQIHVQWKEDQDEDEQLALAEFDVLKIFKGQEIG